MQKQSFSLVSEIFTFRPPKNDFLCFRSLSSPKLDFWMKLYVNAIKNIIRFKNSLVLSSMGYFPLNEKFAQPL
jgi:hypothetical protein